MLDVICDEADRLKAELGIRSDLSDDGQCCCAAPDDQRLLSWASAVPSPGAADPNDT